MLEELEVMCVTFANRGTEDLTTVEIYDELGCLRVDGDTPINRLNPSGSKSLICSYGIGH